MATFKDLYDIIQEKEPGIHIIDKETHMIWMIYDHKHQVNIEFPLPEVDPSDMVTAAESSLSHCDIVFDMENDYPKYATIYPCRRPGLCDYERGTEVPINSRIDRDNIGFNFVNGKGCKTPGHICECLMIALRRMTAEKLKEAEITSNFNSFDRYSASIIAARFLLDAGQYIGEMQIFDEDFATKAHLKGLLSSVAFNLSQASEWMKDAKACIEAYNAKEYHDDFAEDRMDSKLQLIAHQANEKLEYIDQAVSHCDDWIALNYNATVPRMMSDVWRVYKIEVQDLIKKTVDKSQYHKK